MRLAGPADGHVPGGGRQRRRLGQPVRLALTGTLASPPLFEMIEVLGLETTRRRVLALAARIEEQRTPS